MSNPGTQQKRSYFKTFQGRRIPAVSEDEMREVDRIAEDVFALSVLQMMENAGRNLALQAIEMNQDSGRIIVLAGPGGNGGGGLSSARHLHNHGYQVEILLTHEPEKLSGATAVQYQILRKAGLYSIPADTLPKMIPNCGLIIDALLGYSLRGAPRGRFRELIKLSNESGLPILSLDLPSGTDATTGTIPGIAIAPARTLTLALPKEGLTEIPGRLFLGDIGIPPELYALIELKVDPIFSGRHWLELHPHSSSTK